MKLLLKRTKLQLRLCISVLTKRYFYSPKSLSFSMQVKCKTSEYFTDCNLTVKLFSCDLAQLQYNMSEFEKKKNTFGAQAIDLSTSTC